MLWKLPHENILKNHHIHRLLLFRTYARSFHEKAITNCLSQYNNTLFDAITARQSSVNYSQQVLSLFEETKIGKFLAEEIGKKGKYEEEIRRSYSLLQLAELLPGQILESKALEEEDEGGDGEDVGNSRHQSPEKDRKTMQFRRLKFLQQPYSI